MGQGAPGHQGCLLRNGIIFLKGLKPLSKFGHITRIWNIYRQYDKTNVRFDGPFSSFDLTSQLCPGTKKADALSCKDEYFEVEQENCHV